MNEKLISLPHQFNINQGDLLWLFPRVHMHHVSGDKYIIQCGRCNRKRAHEPKISKTMLNKKYVTISTTNGGDTPGARE